MIRCTLDGQRVGGSRLNTHSSIQQRILQELGKEGRTGDRDFRVNYYKGGYNNSGEDDKIILIITKLPFMCQASDNKFICKMSYHFYRNSEKHPICRKKLL